MNAFSKLTGAALCDALSQQVTKFSKHEASATDWVVPALWQKVQEAISGGKALKDKAKKAKTS